MKNIFCILVSLKAN